MKKIIHYDLDQFGTLHCDSCHHETAEKYPLRPSIIGFPCPKCGAPMVTETGYKRARRLVALCDIANRILGPIFGSEYRPENFGTVSVHLAPDKTVITLHDKQ